MSSAADELKIVEVDAGFHRLIPSRFPTIELFERIADGNDEAFKDLESRTNPRLKEKTRLLHGVDAVDGNSPQIQNWNHAPFAYPNPDGTTFFGPDLGVLELAADMPTALVISVRKRECFLSATGEPATGLDMRQLSNRVTGRFADFRHIDVSVETEHRWRLGRTVFEAGLHGVVFRPAERTGGECVAILHVEALGAAVQGDHFRYVWDGERITKVYDFRTATPIYPDDLRTKTSLAA
jgi:hypothetical protein